VVGNHDGAVEVIDSELGCLVSQLHLERGGKQAQLVGWIARLRPNGVEARQRRHRSFAESGGDHDSAHHTGQRDGQIG
jgi:hypothetical protein